MSNAIITVSNLRVGFRRGDDEIAIVDGIDFHVEPGETLGIVGESGSGKSTTGLAILRLLPKTFFASGQIFYGGRDIMQLDQRDLRALRGREISMVLQDPMASLNPVFDIGDQIGEGILAHGDVDAATLERRVIEALRDVRIPAPESRVDDYPHQISGGMKQRVVGAIAISSRPKLLIADEPTTSLDVTIQAQYLQLLKDLQQKFNMSLIFITHDFGVVAKMCDRVCVMYAGQIVETAPVRDIFYRPKHWYTAALIGGMPKLSEKLDRLVSIPGTPPKFGEMPPGCRFAPRCTNAQDRCRREVPTVDPAGPGRDIRCWYPRNLGE
jgi:oligopeptide/dipeptide ABC transporter ATP-binding protein